MEPTSTAMSGIDIASNVIPALAVVIGAPLAIWFWTRKGRNGRVNRLRVTDKAALGKGLWVAVVEIDDQRYLVGAGEGSVGLISELPEAPAVPDESPATAVAPDRTDSLSALAGLTNGSNERPRMGLVQRLQQMTLRTPQRTSTRPFYASRR